MDAEGLAQTLNSARRSGATIKAADVRDADAVATLLWLSVAVTDSAWLPVVLTTKGTV